MNRPLVLACVALCGAAPLAAQSGGVLSGTVRDSASGEPLRGVAVVITDLRREASTDSAGIYRFREVHSGWHRVSVRFIGYREVVRESVLVRAGQTTALNVALASSAIRLNPLSVSVPVDPVLDPLTPATTQRVSAEDLRSLPVSTVEEAVALSAGAVGESYRGGRLGQQAFVLDGLGVKNQLDASTGGLGIRIPPDILTEASLVTNGFSARYGQALSGLINVVTKDGGSTWAGRMAYETDRALPSSWDYGLDRFLVQADGPLFGGIRFVGGLDLTGRLDAEPVNAPAPVEPRDPRSERPNLLPHNSGEQGDVTAKLTIPIGRHSTVRLFGLRSAEQRLLYDPALKYDQAFAPARRVDGSLASAHWQFTPGASFGADVRVAWFDREFLRGQPVETPDYAFGAFTGSRLHFVGEDIARAQDTVTARAPIPGLDPPVLAETSPWGVPAFFLAGGGRGDLAWNRFRELRTQVDVNMSGGRYTDLYFGGEIVRQHVETFQRVLGYTAVGGDVPGATASNFRPLSEAAYGEMQARIEDLALTLGLRYDRFNPRASSGGTIGAARGTFSPRFGISTVLNGATVVVSYGRFAQAPDFQYLVDAAFDDTLRTGRFRAGNPSLGFETATQYEFSVRARPRPMVSVRVNAFRKRLQGLVASVPLGIESDSSIFGNADFGTVIGGEVLVEREVHDGWGVRVSYSLQKAEATATNAFLLLSRIRVAPGGQDTIFPAQVEFPLDYDRRHGLTVILQGKINDGAGPSLAGARPLGGWEAAAIVRWNSGLPYSRTNATADSLIGLPNSYRLPSQSTVDLLLRRPMRFGGMRGSVYFDARNLLNTRNIVAVRRDTGEPGIGDQGAATLAQAAYAAHPEAIPYESPRYRGWADLDHNGLVEGQAELVPLFVAAANDYYQPLFAYGTPRMVRLGVEVVF